jgi:SAM-dependent methyltransferase
MPGIGHENYWFRRHEAGYLHVLDRLGRLDEHGVVVEAGCGEGYGAALVARRTGAAVLAVDVDPLAVAHVASRYGGEGRLGVVRANLVDLPVARQAVDAVVSLQVLEHLWDQPRFVRECLRVLRPGGALALTTPNRRTFPPGNLFHARELDADELTDLLVRAAGPDAVVELHGLAHGPRLRRWEAARGDLVAAQLAAPAQDWSAELAEAVAGVRAEDFVLVDDLTGCLDLLAVVRPGGPGVRSSPA